MNRLLIAVLASIVLAVPVAAQEKIALTTPIAAKPAIADYAPGALTITLVPSAAITVILLATDGTAATFRYPCSVPCAYSTPAQVASLIGQLNNVNLSTRSLWRRIFDRLVADFPERFPGGATVQ